MAMSDKSLGQLLLSSAVVTFVYYTIWALLLPFFDADSPIHGWFPSREWALRIPSLAIVLGISSIGIFVGHRVIAYKSRYN